MTRPLDLGMHFADHASIQAIRHHLDMYRQTARVVASHIVWLERLETRREAEIAAGTWPPAPTHTEEPS